MCILLAGCAEAPKATPPAPKPRAIPYDRKFNDAARFLAGLPGVAGSPFAELEKNEAWKAYAAEFQAAFGRSDTRLLKPVREFSARELPEAAKNGVVYYPFAGPDVLYAQAFYPGAKTYILCGLEKPGSVLDASGYQPETLAAQLAGIRQGSASLLYRSFFVTNEMSQQFRGQLMDGLMPVVLMLMARSGNVIDGVRVVSMNAAGTLSTIEQSPAARGPLPDGFQIAFHREGESEERLLYFFRMDMGAALKADAPFFKFLDGFERPHVLLKSASFLLHSKNFAVMRNYILDHAALAVQDDSGIPYSAFVQKKWKVSLYGAYQRPGPPFAMKFQPDLAEAYAEAGQVREKGFSMGYGTGRRPTALLIARP